MANFSKSFSRELGKNTGKWVSNTLFGDGWSTPHRLAIQNREREERKQQRASAHEYKHQLLQEKRIEREVAKQKKEIERELKQIEKENLINRNLKEIEKHNNYIQIIQSVHKDYSNPIDWDALSQTEPPKILEEPSKMVAYYESLANNEIDNEIYNINQDLKLSLANKIIGKTYRSKNSFIFNFPKYKLFKVLPMLFVVTTFYIFIKGLFWGFITGVIFLVIYLLLKYGSEDFQKISKAKRQIEELENNRENLKQQFLFEHEQYYNKYIEDKNDYDQLMKISSGIKDNNTDSFIYAINFFKPFDDLKNYGSDVSYTFDDTLRVNFFVHDKEVIPNYNKRSVKNGLEIKNDIIVNSRYNEIYQDYVCSCVLRIGKEIFSLLPINEVVVNVKGNILNSVTGNFEDSTILSVRLLKPIIENLNFNLLDPSDSMKNFEHKMNFDKNKGFSYVEDVA